MYFAAPNREVLLPRVAMSGAGITTRRTAFIRWLIAGSCCP